MISQIRQIASQLRAVYPADEAEALAWWLAEETTGFSRTQLQIGCKDTTFFANTQKNVQRLLHFEPIQYIFGHTLWCGLDLKVTPATLIPRPETAELVELVDNYYRHHPALSNAPVRVLDIGTGSGCIAIALKKKHPEWEVTGIDISPEAIEVAKENAKRNNVEVDFRITDIFSFDRFSPVSTFDFVVSNPPYICEHEKSLMRANVLEHEPASALFVPDEDPLRFYRRIASLVLGAHVFFEINENYASEIECLLREYGYTDVRISKDIYGKSRFAEGEWHDFCREEINNYSTV